MAYESDTSTDSGRANAKASYDIDWDTASDEQVVSFVFSNYREGKGRREAWEIEADRQLAWLRGNQSDHLWKWLEEESSADVVPLAERVPIQVNRLRPFVLQQLAMLVGRPLAMRVFPRTADQDDVAAARLSEKVLAFYFQAGVTSGSRMLYDALWEMFGTGLHFAKVTWDPHRGRRDRFGPRDVGIDDADEPTGRTRFQKMIAGMLGTREADVPLDADGGFETPAGELAVEFCSAFDVTEPANARNVGESPWLIHSRLRPMRYGRERYGKRFAEVQPDKGELRDVRRFTSYTSAALGSDNECDEILIHELWVPKSDSVPNGCLVVVAGGKLIHKSEHPYVDGLIPFVPLQELPDPQFFRPGCTIRDAMSLQQAINVTRSMEMGHLYQTINPHVMAEASVDVPRDAFSRVGPQFIKVSDDALVSGRIRPWVPNPLPNHAIPLDQLNRSDLEDVTRVHANTLGRVESSSQSGRAVALNQQANVRASTVTRRLLEESFSKIGQMMLSRAAQFVTGSQLAVLAGERGPTEVFSFTGKQLLGKDRTSGPWNFNVKVVLSEEREFEAMLEQVDTLTARGWLNPGSESDRIAVRRWLGDKFVGDFDEDGPHRGNATIENRDMVAGKTVSVALGDDNPVHIMEHRRFTTTADYREAAALDAGIDVRFRAHLRQHELENAEGILRPMAIAESVRGRLAQEYGLGGPGGPGADRAGPGQPVVVGPGPMNGRGGPPGNGSGGGGRMFPSVGTA
jgi:hypothetical protein